MGRRLSLSAANIKNIQQLYNNGARVKDIAESFGVCQRTIYTYIKQNRNLLVGKNALCPYYDDNGHGCFYCSSGAVIPGRLSFHFDRSDERKKFIRSRCVDNYRRCDFYKE